jgi:hypothetical protein
MDCPACSEEIRFSQFLRAKSSHVECPSCHVDLKVTGLVPFLFYPSLLMFPLAWLSYMNNLLLEIMLSCLVVLCGYVVAYHVFIKFEIARPEI